ncbi:DUF7024 domain-containing protein [Pseudoduganella lutea]|uniref:Uncharacterized protein n=1 Tax=Pseudoduganella lutea TaxID=321985 RepID=A0A4V0Z3T9_9BURK|nr:glycosyltransferase family 39 protein [Pseudoduganella lutea]QBE64603.1 hypothetical protein EWM63_17730 [Pseudoduganella lutea]
MTKMPDPAPATLLRGDSAVALLRRHGFALALGVLALYLVLRSAGMYPAVFADEWLYSKSARLYPLADSILPSWLYLALFGQTSHCGPGFLACARIMNIALYIAAAPFVYGVARTVLGRGAAQALTVVVLLMPVNTYTAYFMPEAMYFLAFCVLAWTALTKHHLPPLRYGLVAGAVLGTACAIKVHGLFLLPPLLAFMLYLCVAGGQGWLRRFAVMAGAALAMTLLVKAALGYLVAGPAGVGLLGSFYGNHATNNEGAGRFARLIAPALTSLYGHVLALAALAALPLATLLAHLAAPKRDRDPALARAQVFVLLMLGAAVAVTVLFTATIADAAPGEGTRLHMRYYNFVLPLLVLLAAAPLAAPQPRERRRRIVVAALMAVPLVLAAAMPLVAVYPTSFVDSPELNLLAATPYYLKLLVAFQLVALAVWALWQRPGRLLFAFLLLPLAMVLGEKTSYLTMASQQVPDPYDKAGSMVRDYLGKEEAAGVTVAGDGAGLLRALFHIDTAGADFIELVPGAPLRANELPPDRRWLVVVGPHPLPDTIVPEIRTPDYALIRLNTVKGELTRVPMADPKAGGVLASVTGLSTPEPWGAWSDGPQVRLTFAAPLPRALRLVIRGNAFGPNQEHDFTLRVGDQQQAFSMGPREQSRVFDMETDGTVTEVTIDVPKPTAPAAIGQGADTRQLGIALHFVAIGSR